MSGFWLVSYIALWAVVLLSALLVFGILQQMGLQRRQQEAVGSASHAPAPGSGEEPEAGGIPPLQDDGLVIGSELPQLTLETMNGYGAITLAPGQSDGRTLLVCLSPLCESCQHVVEPLNALAQSGEIGGRVVVVLRADRSGCEAFLSVFPLRVPVVCDADRRITMGLNAHRTPFGLLYDAQDLLERKGVAKSEDHLRALLGDTAAPDSTWVDIYPLAGAIPPGSAAPAAMSSSSLSSSQPSVRAD